MHEYQIAFQVIDTGKMPDRMVFPEAELKKWSITGAYTWTSPDGSAEMILSVTRRKIPEGWVNFTVTWGDNSREPPVSAQRVARLIGNGMENDPDAIVWTEGGLR